jgi:subtilisin-like proprotein convertase family protein
MKKQVVILVLALTATWLPAQITTISYTNSPNVGIADGSPVGLTEQFNVSGVAGSITNVTVQLDITGGFNGDLYAYLVGPQGQLAVLLNRSGVTGSNPFGYSDAGFNITLDSSSANIHGYGGGYSTNGLGQVTGTWGSDGRNIDPQSAGNVFDSASTSSNLGLFQDGNANGVWTFFIADLASGGGTANLNSVVLTIMTVPEPQTCYLVLTGLLLLARIRSQKSRRLPSR